MGCRTLPGALTFNVSGSILATNFVTKLFMFRAKYSGVTNTNLCLSYQVLIRAKVTCIVYIYSAKQGCTVVAKIFARCPLISSS